MMRAMLTKPINPPNLATMTHAEKDALILALIERLSVLEWPLKKDSHNSNNPPSSDGLKRKPKSLKPKSNAKVGGQVGHSGTTLKQSDTVDHVVIHPLPALCDVCGSSLAGQGALEKEKRQVIDLPAIRFEITEHRIQSAYCDCGTLHRSTFPVDVISPVQYGSRIRSTSVYLTQYQLLPYQRSADAMHDLFGVKLSAGSLVNFTQKAASHLRVAVTQIKQAITAAPVAHFDETGMRVGKTLNWLHSASTETLTWYGYHAKRGEQAMTEFGILPHYHGVAIHDGWSSYRQYDCLHGLCNAHHLRELIYLVESTQQSWASDLIHLLCAAKDEMAARSDPDSTLPIERIHAIKTAYAELVQQGLALNPVRSRSPDQPSQRGRVPQSTATNLLLRLSSYQDDVLRFISDHCVPFDNNQAERDIRMPKLKQKVSGCFRSTEGIESFCTIRSYLATLRKTKDDLMEALHQAFNGAAPAAV
jgi:transposase